MMNFAQIGIIMSGVPTGADAFLFALISQSNGGTDDTDYGRVDYAEMPAYLSAAQPNVYLYNQGTNSYGAFTHPSGQDWGFINQFLYTEQARQNKAIYFTKHSLGGSRLSDTTTSGALYTRQTAFVRIKAAIEKLQETQSRIAVVVLWSHGYTDAIVESTSLDYYENSIDLLAELREYLDIPNLYVIFERLNNSTNPSFKANVRTAQANLDSLSEYNIMIDSDSWELQDVAHYSDAGSIEGGDDYSAAVAAANISITSFGGRSWVPIDLDPYAWYPAIRIDAANTQLEIRESGAQDFVKRFIDQSPAARNILQSTSARQPELINGGLSTAYITCDLARSLVSTTDSVTQDFCQSNFELMFLVDLTDGQPGALRVLFESDSGTGQDVVSLFISSTNKLSSRIKNVTDVFATTSGNPFADGPVSKVLINLRVDYTNNLASIWVNAAQQTLVAGSLGDLTGFNVSNFLPGVFTLFNRDTYSATTGFDGKCYEAMIMNRILSSSERFQYHSWLNSHYGTSLPTS